MDRGFLGWAALAIVVFVYLDLLFVELRRVYRETMRIFTRLGAYADLPIFSLLANVDTDVARLNAALEQLPPLLERARVALATIRRPFGQGNGFSD